MRIEKKTENSGQVGQWDFGEAKAASTQEIRNLVHIPHRLPHVVGSPSNKRNLSARVGFLDLLAETVSVVLHYQSGKGFPADAFRFCDPKAVAHTFSQVEFFSSFYLFMFHGP